MPDQVGHDGGPLRQGREGGRALQERRILLVFRLFAGGRKEKEVFFAEEIIQVGSQEIGFFLVVGNHKMKRTLFGALHGIGDIDGLG